MNVSRLQNGKFNMVLEPVRLDTLFTQVVKTGQMLTTKPLVIEPVSEEVPLWVRGDAIRLELVIINLINNSITHAPTSPKINLSLRKVPGSEQAEIRVQDFGEGIKAAHLTEVFGRFYQVMHGKTATGSGLGLGLFISQQIVLDHGGTIRVESIEGEGTTFIVQLPLIKTEGFN
jgi:signal transduction histidine kinase